jgi:hypothetical protein
MPQIKEIVVGGVWPDGKRVFPLEIVGGTSAVFEQAGQAMKETINTPSMRPIACCLLVFLCTLEGPAADVESRVLTHYLPQDFLETVVRTEKWTPLQLNVKGGLRKGDIIRIWAGGSIDRGNGDRPGQNVAGPAGIEPGAVSIVADKLALAQDPGLAFALMFKTDGPGIKKCSLPGKPLQIKLAKDNEQVWIGFNDEQGRYYDNHLGKGARHELDPAWVRIEVVRIVVD